MPAIGFFPKFSTIEVESLGRVRNPSKLKLLRHFTHGEKK